MKSSATEVVTCISCAIIFTKLGDVFGSVISSEMYQKFTNERYQGTVTYTLTSRSGLACCMSCLAEQEFTCVAVNYNAGDRRCELLEGTTSTLTGQNGWMRVQFKASSCDGDWLHFENKCYKAFYTRKNWDNALSDCQSMGGSLASLQTQDMFDFITYELRASVTFTRYWVGARDYAEDNNVYHWMYGSVVTGYNPWYPGEPNGAAEACVELKNMNGVYNFNDHLCSRTYNYVCEKTLT